MGSILNSTLRLFLVAVIVSACASAGSRPASDGTRVTDNDAQLANESIEHMLERRAPGLQVVPSPEGIVLQIRGNSQIDGALTPPLYVLDGLPFTPGPGGLITGISINEIDTVKVLKGAQAGLYGIDGANGVIVITTKRGTSKN